MDEVPITYCGDIAIDWSDNAVVNVFGKYCDVHIPQSGCYDAKKKNILMVSHTLELGGAPLVLLDMACIYQEKYNVFMVSLGDGALLEKVLMCNIPVAVCAEYQLKQVLDEIGYDSFEMVWLNTLVTYSCLTIFQNTDVEVFWWLHESPQMFELYALLMPDSRLYSPNIHILCVSRFVRENMKKLYGVEYSLLHMPVYDAVGENICYDRVDSEKVIFFMPATFLEIKGQDILARAIVNMPKEYKKKACFVFAGSKREDEAQYYDMIVELAEGYPDTVLMLGELERDEVYSLYGSVDCVVAPSRMDATPTTIVEAMMFGRVCLCSNGAGISMYMKDGVDGFVFTNEDDGELLRKLIYIIDNIDTMEEIRRNGRRIYEENFEASRIREKLIT